MDAVGTSAPPLRQSVSSLLCNRLIDDAVLSNRNRWFVSKYTDRAEECRRMALRARTEAERVSWLALAESWLRMFQAANATSAEETLEARETALGSDQSKAPSSREA